MLRQLSRRFRHGQSLLGLLAAIVALASQISLGTMAPWETTAQLQLAALSGVSFTCHVAGKPGQREDVPHHHHGGDYALSPLSLALAQAGTLLGPALLVSAIAETQPQFSALRPPPRAPPERRAAAPRPRGPPIPV
jgi:hypothetical protein